MRKTDPKMPLAFIVDRNVTSYEPLALELSDELGSRFRQSMANWSGIGTRPYPLPVWQVYVTRDETHNLVGVCSYYQQEDDPPGRYWVGWIGVLKRYRRSGKATEMWCRVRDEVMALGATQLWVYTDSSDAEAFYRSVGMVSAGTFAETGLEQAAAGGDESVLCMNLS